ncbi:MAG: ATP-dependent DNA helicase [Deltaproteobacteria bacterium]|nr:ATP-dependent DNA helicase [Deltaproteobacteria bacterium]
MAEQAFLPGTEQALLFDTIRTWQDATATGDRAELNALPDDHPLWRDLTATSEQCLGKTCRDYERCFVTQMRRRAQTAHLVIVNHHLYFADLALRARFPEAQTSILPPHDLVIFDEAHDLDEVAAQHFGFHVSLGRVNDLAHDVERSLAADASLAARVQPALDRLVQRAQRLFELIPGGEARSLLSEVPASLRERQREVDEALEALEAQLAGVAVEEAPQLARRAVALAAELAFVLDVPGRHSTVLESTLTAAGAYVRYSEQMGRSRQLVARPIDVADLIGAWLDTMPAVFVSATLAVGGRFEHFRSRLGLTQARELLVGSPFDYENHARLYLPDDLPEPDDPAFVSAAAARAAALVAASGGGTFVLCTSHRVLPSFADELSHGTNARVLVQGDAPRAHLLAEFRADGHAVLVATMSFWQGVDVPGNA